jgi:hypothetical protein
MFSYHGGMLWVDFINTEYMHQGTVLDQIEDLQGVLDWAEGAGVALGDIRAEAARESAERQAAAWQELSALRRDLRRLAEEIGEKAAVAEATRDALNRHLACGRSCGSRRGRRLPPSCRREAGSRGSDISCCNRY